MELNQPVILSMSMLPLYKLIVENNKPVLKNITLSNNNNQKYSFTKIQKYNSKYVIKIGDEYISKNLGLTDKLKCAILFNIQSTPTGYKFLVDDLCLSRGF